MPKNEGYEMRLLKVLFLTGLLVCYSHANAWFFFFIPGSVTRAVGDAVTGAKGDVCVPESVKVGDSIPSIAGNTMKILSLSGTSSLCTNPATPIRADVEYTFTFKSNAGVSLSDDYEAKPLTDYQRYNGTLLIATSKSQRNKGVLINSREKRPNTDPQGVASAFERAQIAALADAQTKNAEMVKLNGSQAWRFEVHGKTKGTFGTEMVYIITVMEGDNEVLVVNTFTPTSSYQRDRDELRKVAEGVSGIKTQETQVASPTTAPPQSLSPAADSVGTQSNLASKLRELAKLLADGLITKAEYETKRAELLKSF